MCLNVRRLISCTALFILVTSMPMSRAQQHEVISQTEQVKAHLEKLARDASRLWAEGRMIESYHAGEAAIGFAKERYGARSVEIAGLFVSQGITSRNLWGDEKSTRLFEDALSIYEERNGPNDKSVLLPLFYLAEQQEYLGRRAEAEALLLRYIEVAKFAQGETSAGIGNALNRLGMMKRSWGQTDAALKLFTEAVSVYAKNGSYWSVVGLNPAAQAVGLLIDVGQLMDAEAMLREAKKVVEFAWLNAPENAKGPFMLPSFEKYLRLEEARIFMKRYEWTLAKATAEGALALSERINGSDSIQNLDALKLLGEIAVGGKSHSEAERIAERRLAISSSAWADTTPRFVDLWREIAIAKSRSGKMKEAVQSMENAVHIATLPQNLNLVSSKAIVFHEAAMLYLKASKLMAEAERDRLWSLAFDAMQWRLRGQAAAAMVAAGARARLDNRDTESLIRQRETAIQEISSIELDLTREIGKSLAMRDNRRVENLRDDLASKISSAKQLESQIATVAPGYASLAIQKPASLEEIRSSLSDDDAVVLMSDGYPALVFTASRTNVGWRQVPRDNFEAMAERLRCALTMEVRCDGILSSSKEDRLLNLIDGISGFPFDDAYGMFKVLFADDAAKTIEGRRNIYLLSDGIFASLPMSVLLTDSAPQLGSDLDKLRHASWMVRRHSMTVLLSLRSLLAKQHRVDKFDAPLLGIGDPMLRKVPASPPPCDRALVDQAVLANTPPNVTELLRSGRIESGRILADTEKIRQMQPLPDSRCELEAIATLVGAGSTDLLLGEKATEGALKERSAEGKLRGYKMLVFATHGLAAGELGQAEPALVLSPPARASIEDDGLLTASEIAVLDIPADWVILSACNTAGGSRDDVNTFSGLSRAFFYAGAKSVLVSHWPVASDAAVRLTTGTLSMLSKDAALSRSNALQLTILNIIDTAKTAAAAAPRYWAPFSYVSSQQ